MIKYRGLLTPGRLTTKGIKNMKCPICGKETEGNEKFCTSCGAKLDTAVQEVTEKAEQAAELPKPNPPAAPYVNTAAAATAVAAPAVKPKKQKRDMSPCKPLSTWGFIWRSIVFCIPVIGLIVMFVMAFAKGINENSRSFARCCLIFLLIAVIIAIIAAVLGYIFREPVMEWIGNVIRGLIAE